MTDRPSTLPHDPEAERAVLGSVLLENPKIKAVRDVLYPNDFCSARNRQIFSALVNLDDAGSPLDPVILKDHLRRNGELEAVGGPAYLAQLVDGVPRAANVLHYAALVRDAARRRALITRCQGLVDAAGEGASRRDLLELADALGDEFEEELGWKPEPLEGVERESAGEVQYVAENLIPRGEVTILGASWKTGKSLVVYRIVLDLLLGRSVFGRFSVPCAQRVVVFQLEMPSSEDERRFRKIALGSETAPSAVSQLARDGRLLLFNRPPLDLTTPRGRRTFQHVVRSSNASVVVIDSLLAAFAGLDLNDNSVVRKAFRDAFQPLTSAGITIILLHHKRKTQTGKGWDDERSALLGAQAWGAATGRVYALQRLNATENGSEFTVRLALVGSWTPEGETEQILRVNDIVVPGSGRGTEISVLSKQEQIAVGGVTRTQQIGIAIAQMVRLQRRIPRQEAFKSLMDSHGVSERTLKNGQKYAQENQWIETTPSPSRKRGEVDFVPGRLLDEDDG